MKSRVCTSCGFVGQAVPQDKDSFLLDGLFWLAFGSFTLMSGLLPLMLIPLAWTLYHLAKFNTTQCPECSSLDMVDVNSRKGRKTLSAEQNVEVWTNPATGEGH